MLTYKDEKSTFIESNWLTPYKIRNLIVTGSDAIMRLEYLSQELWIENGTESRQPRYPIEEPLKLELQHFAKCVIEKIQPRVTGLNGVKALEVVEAAIKSSEKDRVIELK